MRATRVTMRLLCIMSFQKPRTVAALFNNLVRPPAARRVCALPTQLRAISGRSTNSKSRRGEKRTPNGDRIRYNSASSIGKRRPLSTTSNGSTGPSVAANGEIFTTLQDPTILFHNHHILVVNKPPGWHSVPNEHSSTKKCLLNHLKQGGLGGGSMNDFLLPMHRIDQPCTGALLYAKNSKAGTRITTAWKKGLVEKEYWCVVEGNILDMIGRSKPLKKSSWRKGDNSELHDEEMQSMTDVYTVQGILKRHDSSRSVIVQPVPNGSKIDEATLTNGARRCHIQWKHLGSVPKPSKQWQNALKLPQGHRLELISVKTATGARHQVRAMLSQILKSPVAGDLRYGAAKGLPDQSVALHARSLFLPTVQLGGTDLSSCPFVSPIPSAWLEYFGLREVHRFNN